MLVKILMLRISAIRTAAILVLALVAGGASAQTGPLILDCMVRHVPGTPAFHDCVVALDQIRRSPAPRHPIVEKIDPPDPMKPLYTLRTEPVLKRRKAATSADAVSVKLIQDQIDAVDRALIDELLLSPGEDPERLLPEMRNRAAPK
ncbi:hypothetical protein [Terrarubrum flagellatum]|uniref:hypothetical protein n=1 Tax=Terrirubrum flagellatum TaxID=2895980 RepID=UPI00314536AE